MGRTYQILLPLLSLFLVRVDLTDLIPLHISVRISKVLDGDTVEVSSGNQHWRIRLSRIDAPEKTQRFLNSSEDAGKSSRQCLLDLGPEKYQTLRIDGFDMYGRILGDIDRLSFDLIKYGCVGLYPFAKFSSEGEKFNYLREMDSAKKHRKGLWQRGGYLLPKKWRQISKQTLRRQWRR